MGAAPFTGLEPADENQHLGRGNNKFVVHLSVQDPKLWRKPGSDMMTGVQPGGANSISTVPLYH